ncbi:MAG: tetratricopeptide repeat protein [Prevotella sp.]|nr:tetratricopeptide repeat protein [Prevotella sp.]
MNSALSQALQTIHLGRLTDAIRQVRQFMTEHPYIQNSDELERIESDYQLMLDYMQRGFSDPARADIYASLLSRLSRYVRNLNIDYLVKKSPFFIETAKRVPAQRLSHERIRETLESFVADVAMLSLEADDQRREKSATLYSEHHDFMSSLFCSIVVSRQWTEADALFYQETLLSPTIDVVDVQMLVSAIMLSAMNNADPLKLATLLHVYRHTDAEQVRQRALVGWVFCLSSRHGTPALTASIREICQDEQTVRQLLDMQKQMIFCMKADADYEHISRDIMPTLIKNNNFNITRQGIITEKEDDPMEDILDPGAADRRMEEMEESIQKMMSMQKAGSDIYFGGFSQMKRFAFFYQLANWFTPFYAEHPGLSAVNAKLKNRRFMNNLLESGPFCDSDKYSFALAMSSIIDRLPENMRSLLDNSEALGPIAPPEEQQTPAYIRRMYLQDLYRFFRLYPQRNNLRNPFDAEHAVFAASPVFTSTLLTKHYASLCMFFRKQKNMMAFGELIHQYYDNDDVNCKLLRATYFLESNQPSMARPELERLLELDPEHERGLLLLARTCFMEEDYEEAADLYGKLHKRLPQNKNYALNYCLALCKNGDYQSAVTLLYQLDYEHPNQPDIMRIQAWALMGTKKLEQAERVYSRLLDNASSRPAPDSSPAGTQPSPVTQQPDYLNAAYCQWFKGDIAKAVVYLKEYVKDEDVNLDEDFANDLDMLSLYQISDTDLILMRDLVMTR